MAKSQQSWNKKEREKKKQKEKQDKAEKRLERKAASADADTSLDGMMAWIDENGNIVDAPPDPSRRKEINLEDIVIGVPKYDASQESSDGSRSGIITFYNDAKGFGFIRDLRTGESIFVHANSADFLLKENMKVSFDTEKGPKGLAAVRVQSAG
jgi:cold shock CspA family protein